MATFLSHFLAATLHTALLFVITLPVSVKSVEVNCSFRNEVCDCGTPVDGICEFTLEIERLLTFARYEVTDDGKTRGKAGRAWYINETGYFLPHPFPPAQENSPVVCHDIDEESDECTEAFAVDGYTFRTFIAVNGRFPAPTLIVNKDDYVVVNVINQLASESISVHWHGMHQRDSHWMDGVERVTQCGILPGTSFTYVFQAEQSGTHWYHSHSGAQRSEGLFGALIVRENEARLFEVREIVGEFEDFPGEHTLTFLDWQAKDSLDIFFTQLDTGFRFFNATRAPKKDTRIQPVTFSIDEVEVGPFPYWSGLINGRGRHRDISYAQSRLTIFTVQPNKVYRFRLIGAQSLYAYRVSIDEHKLTVIASDGAFVKPLEVDYIIIHSGERYDFLLKTSNQSETDFMIRAETLETYVGIGGNSLAQLKAKSIAEAILHYETESSVLPKSINYEEINRSSTPVECKSTESPCKALNCPFKDYYTTSPSITIDCIHIHELQILTTMSVENMSVENEWPDVHNARELFLNFGFEGVRSSSSVNARTLTLPSVPLSQLISKDAKRSEINFCDGLDNSTICDNNLDKDVKVSPDCTCTHVIEIEDDRSVQLVLAGVSPASFINGFSHPIHLHGHYFHVVDIQFGEYDENGVLTKKNDDIDCSGSKLCTKPQWAEGIDKDYSMVIENAPQKDTIFVPHGGYAVVYFTPNNPGYWFIHCHVEDHQVQGMGVIIAEAADKATSPPEGMAKCGNFDFDVESFKRARSNEKPMKLNNWMIIGVTFIVFSFLISMVGIVWIARKIHHHFHRNDYKRL